MKSILQQYGTVSLLNIEADRPEEWDTSGATHVRVSLPPDAGSMLQMQEMGYQFVDRMLDVTVGLRNPRMDFGKAVRIRPEPERARRDEIRQLAVNSFVRDRRFHVEAEYNNELSAAILDGWIAEIPEFYVCNYKGKLIGFLALKENPKEGSAAIHLAAVDERYRASGAAVSIYAAAMQAGQEKGLQKITGYISSGNPAVMNLYAYFGGSFSNPRDIYVKKNCL